MLFLAIVDVLALAIEFVVASDRGLELSGRQAELLGKLLNRISLLNEAVGIIGNRLSENANFSKNGTA